MTQEGILNVLRAEHFPNLNSDEIVITSPVDDRITVLLLGGWFKQTVLGMAKNQTLSTRRYAKFNRYSNP